MKTQKSEKYIELKRDWCTPQKTVEAQNPNDCSEPARWLSETTIQGPFHNISNIASPLQHATLPPVLGQAQTGGTDQESTRATKGSESHRRYLGRSTYNYDAFANLMFQTLVDQQVTEYTGFDDHIKGKGKGLIILPHGPPGVGKTFTAESIADYTRRPLLTISSGQIIGPAPWVESRLSELLSLATRWDALALMDDSDVFIQERVIQHLDGNALVSVFLRILEYFQGTMFLTTIACGHCTVHSTPESTSPSLIPRSRQLCWIRSYEAV
ncbi:hypothetical protein B0T25DRAFT_515719 [Lasiosphaeria hispida]|uniref:ATPase AAA-type core domain-containing protein n=1 Tax=Lasiosphaeria hispida TaxID=260671 RepID=A0AAJ0MIM0_9PEZI|nr:hypothetical protein B0T25DRAFT_515719 [Lasiosphaeria hispida]